MDLAKWKDWRIEQYTKLEEAKTPKKPKFKKIREICRGDIIKIRENDPDRNLIVVDMVLEPLLSKSYAIAVPMNDHMNVLEGKQSIRGGGFRKVRFRSPTVEIVGTTETAENLAELYRTTITKMHDRVDNNFSMMEINESENGLSIGMKHIKDSAPLSYGSKVKVKFKNGIFDCTVGVDPKHLYDRQGRVAVIPEVASGKQYWVFPGSITEICK